MRPADVARVARLAGAQPLPQLAAKVAYLRELVEQMEATPGGGGMEALLWRMQRGLSLEPDEALQQVLAFIQKLEAQRGGLRQLDSAEPAVARLVENFPSVLARSLEGDVAPAVRHLADDWGVARGQLARVLLAYPPLLLSSWQRDVLPIKRALKEAGVRVRDMGRMLAKYPWLLAPSVAVNLGPIAAFLQSTAKMPLGDVDRAITRCPQLLGCDAANALPPAVARLEALGLRSRRLGRALARSPKLLTRSAQELRQVVGYLEQLGLPPADVAHILQRAPEVFASDAERTLAAKVSFLEGEEELGLARQWLPRVIGRFPEVLTMDVEGMRRRVAFLRGEVGLSASDIRHMACSYPPLLGCNVDTVLRPKLDYLREGMGREAREVVAFPKYFSHALEGKIKRRARVVAAGWGGGGAPGGAPGGAVSLREMLGCSDDEFAARFLGLAHFLLPPPPTPPPVFSGGGGDSGA